MTLSKGSVMKQFFDTLSQREVRLGTPSMRNEQKHDMTTFGTTTRTDKFDEIQHFLEAEHAKQEMMEAQFESQKGGKCDMFHDDGLLKRNLHSEASLLQKHENEKVSGHEIQNSTIIEAEHQSLIQRMNAETQRLEATKQAEREWVVEQQQKLKQQQLGEALKLKQITCILREERIAIEFQKQIMSQNAIAAKRELKHLKAERKRMKKKAQKFREWEHMKKAKSEEKNQKMFVDQENMEIWKLWEAEREVLDIERMEFERQKQEMLQRALEVKRAFKRERKRLKKAKKRARKLRGKLSKEHIQQKESEKMKIPNNTDLCHFTHLSGAQILEQMQRNLRGEMSRNDENFMDNLGEILREKASTGSISLHWDSTTDTVQRMEQDIKRIIAKRTLPAPKSSREIIGEIQNDMSITMETESETLDERQTRHCPLMENHHDLQDQALKSRKTRKRYEDIKGIYNIPGMPLF